MAAKNSKKPVALSIIFGFVVAFVALGLPMIGVMVNLWLGSGVLFVAFVLLAYGFVRWEKIAHWPEWLRTSTVWVAAICYLLLVGYQVNVQYRKDHNHTVASPQRATTPVAQPTPPSTIPSANKVIRKHQPVSSEKASTTTPKSTAPAPGTYQQQCTGSGPCAQGPGAQAILNQYGAPKLVMTESQRNTIRDAMKPYAGLKFLLERETPTDDSDEYASQLRKAFTDAGLICEADGTGQTFGKVPAGISLLIGTSIDPAANALGRALKTAGLIDHPLPATRNNVRPEGFDITVAPNR